MVNICGVFFVFTTEAETFSQQKQWKPFLPNTGFNLMISSFLFTAAACFTQPGWKILPGVGNTGKDGPTEAGAADDAGLGTVFCPVLDVLGRETHEVVGDPVHHRKIRQWESNAICRYLKKLASKGTLRQAFYMSEAPAPLMTPYSLPPYTMYTCIQHIYSHRERGGGRANQRGALVHKAGRKYQHDCLYPQSINSIKNQ